MPLRRFVEAQDPGYQTVLAELRSGHKCTHWMWFIFPQLAGLGQSATARRFAIEDIAEAERYLAHPVLGARLTECSRIVLGVMGRTAHEIFGTPDDLKLRSSMTLFAAVSGADNVFAAVIEKYFEGDGDERTLELLAK